MKKTQLAIMAVLMGLGRSLLDGQGESRRIGEQYNANLSGELGEAAWTPHSSIE